eukprot:CAMPEP_0118672044 /NCGR_PEP_ID=MMETSP0785-20121206/22329_1 /TAXON_ID=91992 /ORGANISM="Bolidomonas pacifica, Strain CCMP 1866" /LENGTH=389 /DNA_ID=CAMNT_0006566977 /DNA_START=140 /DNA_END=1306 /DNA_ORIENTATION=-
MFSQRDINNAVLDCEKQLAKTRMRLKKVQGLKLTSPTSNEEDSVVLRKKVRLKGFDDESNIGLSLGSGGGGTKKGRRSSLSNEVHEKIKDRIIRTFNLDAGRGLVMMRENGFGRTPEQTARFLLNTGGLNREMIGRALGMGRESLRLYAEGVEMEGLPFFICLRRFLGKFKLPGEAQQVDRVLEAFARAFCKVNPEAFAGGYSVVHGIAFAVVILNTDIHSQNLNKSKHIRMTKDQFIDNTRHMEGCSELSKEFLESIYDDISANEIVHQENKDDLHGNLFSDSVKEGWMKKKAPGIAVTSWRRRWFILTKNPPQLTYFEDEKTNDPKGYIPLVDVGIVKSTKHKKGLELFPENGGTLKSAKYLRGELVVGEHQIAELKAESVEESWSW